jgi:hypothetical protein
MKNPIARVIVFAVLAAAFSAPVLAHHSIAAEFYMDQQWSQTGVLNRVEWINPHTVTWIDVKDQQTGKITAVGCQGGPPNRYSRNGFTPADWKVGQVVTITCNPAKNGDKNWGFIKTLQYQSDGHTLELGRAGRRF